MTYRIRTISSDKPNTYPYVVEIRCDGVLVACEGGRDWDEHAYLVSVAVSRARAGMGWRRADRARKVRENEERWAKEIG